MRDISIAAQEQIVSNVIRPLFLVTLQFANESIAVWSGVGDFVWSGTTFKGVGTLGNISPIVETTETQAQGITLSLSGIPNQYLQDALNHVSTSGIAQVFLAFMDSSGNLIGDPIPAYIGELDAPEIDMSTETTTISIAVENKLSDLQRARGGRLTDADQRARHPNDGGLKFVSQIQDKFIQWGNS